MKSSWLAKSNVIAFSHGESSQFSISCINFNLILFYVYISCRWFRWIGGLWLVIASPTVSLWQSWFVSFTTSVSNGMRRWYSSYFTSFTSPSCTMIKRSRDVPEVTYLSLTFCCHGFKIAILVKMSKNMFMPITRINIHVKCTLLQVVWDTHNLVAHVTVVFSPRQVGNKVTLTQWHRFTYSHFGLTIS